MKAFNVSKKYQLAEILGISPQNFSNKANKGTVLKSIEMEALKRKVNYDWILLGEGEASLDIKKSDSTLLKINESQKSYGPKPFAQAVSDLREIFDSGDQILITAIQANLSAFKEVAIAKALMAIYRCRS